MIQVIILSIVLIVVLVTGIKEIFCVIKLCRRDESSAYTQASCCLLGREKVKPKYSQAALMRQAN